MDKFKAVKKYKGLKKQTRDTVISSRKILKSLSHYIDHKFDNELVSSLTLNYSSGRKIILEALGEEDKEAEINVEYIRKIRLQVSEYDDNGNEVKINYTLDKLPELWDFYYFNYRDLENIFELIKEDGVPHYFDTKEYLTISLSQL